jgi:hypothetical protein
VTDTQKRIGRGVVFRRILKDKGGADTFNILQKRKLRLFFWGEGLKPGKIRLFD